MFAIQFTIPGIRKPETRIRGVVKALPTPDNRAAVLVLDDNTSLVVTNGTDNFIQSAFFMQGYHEPVLVLIEGQASTMALAQAFAQ